MKEIVRVMLRIWDMNTMDWMGYDNQERYSFHHIVKKADGGNQISLIDNGAILHQNSSHPYLHTIEYYDLDKYIFINNILRQINDQRCMPSTEQLKQIKLVLKEFQNEYEGKVSSRDKPIIKKEYRID